MDCILAEVSTILSHKLLKGRKGKGRKGEKDINMDLRVSQAVLHLVIRELGWRVSCNYHYQFGMATIF